MYKINILTQLLNKNLFGKKHGNPDLTKNNSLTTKFENKPYDVYKLDRTPATNTELTKTDALLFYRQMQAMRRMENSLANLYKEKKIRGFCHLYSGQEACACGVKAAMRPDDTVITAYRCHGWMILLGATYQEVIAELLGRKSGSARGKGGSMHMFCKNFYGGNGIVGAHVPVGAGLGFAHKYLKRDAISITVYGDGAANQGQVFEAFNISKLWNLPIIYAIENNQYALGTPAKRHTAQLDMYKRGDYIPGIRLDGMDVLAVREGARFCIDYVKSGNGPILLEMLTYRYFGHSMSDPGTSYRSRDEIKQVRDTRDPIKMFSNKIITAKLVTEAELKKLDDEVKKEVDDAIQTSLADKEVPLEELYYDVGRNFPYKIRMPALNRYMDHKNVGFK